MGSLEEGERGTGWSPVRGDAGLEVEREELVGKTGWDTALRVEIAGRLEEPEADSLALAAARALALDGTREGLSSLFGTRVREDRRTEESSLVSSAPDMSDEGVP